MSSKCTVCKEFKEDLEMNTFGVDAMCQECFEVQEEQEEEIED